MRNSMIYTVSATFLLIIVAESSFADRADRRQVRQRARIHHGVKSGELTTGEAAALRAGERKVRRMERRAEADGTVTTNEAAKIENAQDRLSNQIYEQKHDEQKRGD